MMVALFPREFVTADNYSPIVSVITWILLVSMILGVVLQVMLKVLTLRKWDTSDQVLCVAMVITTP